MVKPSEAEKNLGGGSGLAGPNAASERKLYVGNLPINMTELHLRKIFEAYGPVELVQLPTDPETLHCKGFGFVQFAQLEHAKAAQSLNGKLEIVGLTIKVSSVTEHVGVQDAGAKTADFDDDEGGGLSAASGGGSGLAGPDAASERKIYVGNLHFIMTELQLRQIFEAFGPVELVQIPTDPETGYCKGFGFVQFAQLEHAKAAQSLNGKLDIAGRTIKVSSVTEHVGVQDARAKTADFDDDEGGGLSAASGGASGLAGPDAASERKLYVGNLHFNMTELQLRQIFEAYGPVELVQIPTDPETGHFKGFGFVQFAQLEHAKAAQSLNGKLEIAGRTIKVSSVTEHVGVQDA